MVGGLLVKAVGQLDDLRDEPSLAGLEHALFGVGEAGELEVRERFERLLGLEEAGLELARGGAERGDRGLARRRRGGARIAQQRLAGRGVWRRPPGGEQGVGLAGAEPVAHDAVGQPFLVGVRQQRQGGGRGGREAPVVEMASQLGGEPMAEGQASVHPSTPVPEELGDLGGREMILGGERVDHARLVHRARGAPGGVGLEQSGLAHDRRASVVLDDYRDVGMPRVAPVGQPLEAIEDFVGAVTGGRHPQRQRGQRRAGIRARAAEGRQRRGEVLDGDVEDQAHARASARGRSW
jgi:hypothetical protein